LIRPRLTQSLGKSQTCKRGGWGHGDILIGGADQNGFGWTYATDAGRAGSDRDAGRDFEIGFDGLNLVGFGELRVGQ